MEGEIPSRNQPCVHTEKETSSEWLRHKELIPEIVNFMQEIQDYNTKSLHEIHSEK